MTDPEVGPILEQALMRKQPPAVVYRFGQDISAPRHARRQLRPLVGDGRLAEDVTLVSSELVTNTLRHTDHGGELRVWTDHPLRLEVQDSSPALPSPRADSAVGGKGLGIIEALCSKWGVTPIKSGKVMWAEFERPFDCGQSG